MMKKAINFLLFYCLVLYNVSAQEIAYTGGNGSGYITSNTQQLFCSMFAGGNADGFANNTTTFINCTMFYGDSADGAAQNITPLLNCTMFYGDSADGSASKLSAITACPPFFGGIGDGYDLDSVRFCQILLPLKILEFYGVKETNKNWLYWKVAEAQDLRWFEVERSGDGLNFTKIGIVQAAGNSYQFPDDKPLLNVNYYRLRIVEQNNNIFYSNIVVLRSNVKNQINIYPNPTKNHVNVYCYSDQNRTVTINLYDMRGRSIRQQVINLSKGGNNFIVNLENVATGTYLLTIKEMGESVRLVVVN